MILSTTSSKIQIKLHKAIVTNQLPILSCYADNTTTTLTAITTSTSTNSTTLVDIISAPAASTQRIVKFINVFNADTIQAAVQIRYFDGSSGFEQMEFVLNPNDTLIYSSENGWKIIDTYGLIRDGLTQGGSFFNSPIKRPHGHFTSSATSKTLTKDGTCFAVYLGKASRDFSTIKISYFVSTLEVGAITWAEMALATGSFVIGGNASLTLLGSAVDISTDIQAGGSTGQKSRTLTGSGKVGDDIWLLIACLVATTAPAIRGGVADDTQHGFQQTAAAVTRPSTMAAPTSFTVEGTTVSGISCLWQEF